MQEHNPNTNRQGDPGRQRLRLPFEKRNTDVGSWSYYHRVGICVTVIAYLVIAIIFISARIEMGRAATIDGILIEFPEEEIVREQIDMPEYTGYNDFSDVRNLQSNQNAQLNSQLRDDRGSSASDLYESAGSLDEQMRANREAYEQGLREEQAMIDQARRNASDDGANSQRQDTKVDGRVTVSFSFVDPVRSSVRLVVPAYRCEGGGQVVVNATLNNLGEVVSATVDRSASTSDDCMQKTAVQAAQDSRFNSDNSAPSRQRGTITYIFIPQ